MNKIPSVNLADFLSDDVSKKQQFVSEIGQAYENIGFVALKGHFLDDALVDKLYTQIKNFFDLPTETKKNMKYLVLVGSVVMFLSEKKVLKAGKKEI
jgi:isopenicillin N synthase-like dioxygenase